MVKYLKWSFVVLIFITSCKKTPSQTQIKSKSKELVSYSTQSKFIEGMGYFLNAKYVEAMERFQACNEIAPNDPGINYMIARTYMIAKEYVKANKYAQKAVEANENQKDYFVVLAESQKKLNKFDDAVKTYEKMLANTKGGESYLYDLYDLQISQKNYNGAFHTLNKIDEVFGFNSAVTEEKVKILLRQNKKTEAVELLNNSIKENPDEIALRLFLVRFYIENQKYTEAEATVDATLEKFPDDATSLMLKYELIKKRGAVSEAEKYLEKIFLNKNIDIDTKVDLILSMFKEIENKQSDHQKYYKYVEQVISSHPDNAKSYAMAGDVYAYSDNKKEAVKNYRKSVQLDPSKNVLWVQLCLLELQENEKDSLLVHTKKAQEYFPLDARFPYFAGSVLYQAKEYTSALKNLKQANSLLGTDSELKDNVRSLMADCYYYTKEYEKSDEIFEQLLAENPKNYSAMNNYCYFLSLRKEKLDVAEKLGNDLVKNNPKEATFLDTYGWVLYVKKDYKNAVTYLEKAVDGYTNGTICEHYGDALFQLGQQEKALEMWNKAKKLGETSEFLDKKISDKKLYE